MDPDSGPLSPLFLSHFSSLFSFFCCSVFSVHSVPSHVPAPRHTKMEVLGLERGGCTGAKLEGGADTLKMLGGGGRERFQFAPGTWGDGGGIWGRSLREAEIPHSPEGSEEAWLCLETRREARWRTTAGGDEESQRQRAHPGLMSGMRGERKPGQNPIQRLQGGGKHGKETEQEHLASLRRSQKEARRKAENISGSEGSQHPLPCKGQGRAGQASGVLRGVPRSLGWTVLRLAGLQIAEGSGVSVGEERGSEEGEEGQEAELPSCWGVPRSQKPPGTLRGQWEAQPLTQHQLHSNTL